MSQHKKHNKSDGCDNMNSFSAPPPQHQALELHAGHNDRFNPDVVYNVLAQTPNGNLVEGFLSEGQSLTLMPSSYHEGMTDVFFILEGEIILRAKGQSQLLRKHAVITSDTLQQKAKLEARSSVRYLHFLAPPWFVKNNEEGQVIRMNSGSFNTVFSRGSVEMTIGTVNAGKTLFVTPPEQSNSVEIYYLLDGLLTLEEKDAPVILKSGDYLVARDLESTMSCFANTDTTYLYFSNLAKSHWIDEFHNKLMTLAVQVEEKDGYTAQHCLRIQNLSSKTGERLNLSSEQMLSLELGAYMHDLGKLHVPIEILQKPGKLTKSEWEIIKQHPTSGRILLEGCKIPNLETIVEQHHERLDGSGYPKGLKDSEILVESYIVAIADTFDAMTTDRPYRKALSKDVAIQEIQSLSDKHYPKEVVEAFILASEGA